MPTKLSLLLLLSFTALPLSAQTHEVVPIQIEEEVAGPVYELRLYQVKDPLNGSQAMHQMYKSFDRHAPGRYFKAYQQYIWDAIQLPNGKTYSVISSGSEGSSGFFSSFMVFDVNGTDALSPNHPDRDYLVRHLDQLVKELDPAKGD